MSDESLIKACVKGEEWANRQLFDKLSPKMMAVCLRYANDEDEAFDLLQDGFIKVFQKIHLFKFDGSFEGWVRRTMVNTCLDHIRKNKKLKNHQSIEESNFEHPHNELISSDINTQELLKLIQRLPDGYRTVFNLFAIEGYSHKEIGDQLGVTENTSKSQFRKAKLQLQQWVNELELRY